MMSVAALLFAATFHLPAQKSDAIIGFASHDLMFGAGYSERWDEHFPMGALASVPIAIAVLHGVDCGELRPDAVMPLVERAVKLGDTAASDRLLRMIGVREVNRTMATLGVPQIRVDRGTATPWAMEGLFEAIVKRHDGLSEASNDQLVGWMETSAGASRIRAGLPPGAKLAHVEGATTGATSDAVIFDGFNVVVVFTKNARSPRRLVERDIVAVTHSIWDWMNSPGLLSARAVPLPPQTSDAIIGVSARILPFKSSWCERDEERFPMGGLARVPIAVEVLHRVDDGTLRPDRVIPLLERMMTASDARAEDRLLRLVGARAVNRRMAALGVPEIRVDRGTTTPDAMAYLFTAIVRHDDDLSEASRDRLLRWMETLVELHDQRLIVILTKGGKSPRKDVESDVAAVTRYVQWMMDVVSAPSPGSQK